MVRRTAALLAALSLLGPSMGIMVDLPAQEVEVRAAATGSWRAQLLALTPPPPQCIGDEIVKGELAVARYSIVAGDTRRADLPKVTMSVRAPDERQLARKRGTRGRFVFTGREDGHHTMCVINSSACARRSAGRQPLTGWHAGDKPLRVDISLTSGAEAKDYDAVAKKEHLSPIELNIRRAFLTVEEILEEVRTSREEEIQRRDMNGAGPARPLCLPNAAWCLHFRRRITALLRAESTNELILWFSVLSTVVVCSVSVTQVYLLRRFFKSKKLM